MIKTGSNTYTVKNTSLPNGCNIAYTDEGKGTQTILFIHGLATYGLSWKKNIDDLKKQYRCIAIDLPGNGLSDKGDLPYTMQFFAETVYQFVQQLKLKHVVLCGHSMGGQIAIATLLQHPHLATQLVLCAPAGFEKFTPFEATMYQSSISFLDFFSTDENSLRQTIRSGFYTSPTQGDEMVDELIALMHTQPASMYRLMVERCISGMMQAPVFHRLHELQLPTLVLFGSRDALIPNRLIHPITTRQLAETGTRQIPNAILRMVDGCGHFLQWEKAEEVNEHIEDFLG